jgi:tetratricopeptide (TPR) repeat protein
MTDVGRLCVAWAVLGLSMVSAVEAGDLEDGLAALKAKNYDRAIARLSAVIQSDPKNAEAYLGRGVAYLFKEDHDRAIRDCDEALRLHPGAAEGDTYHRFAAEAHYRRGTVFRDKKDYGRAAGDFREAVRLNPDYVRPHNDLAWLLATCPQATLRDGREAIQLATRACELTEWKNPRTLDTLAAAYAETGQFTAAVQWQKKSLESPGLMRPEIEQARKRLSLYERGERAREE